MGPGMSLRSSPMVQSVDRPGLDACGGAMAASFAVFCVGSRLF